VGIEGAAEEALEDDVGEQPIEMEELDEEDGGGEDEDGEVVVLVPAPEAAQEGTHGRHGGRENPTAESGD
jgi:hypothetical protein